VGGLGIPWVNYGNLTAHLTFLILTQVYTLEDSIFLARVSKKRQCGTIDEKIFINVYNPHEEPQNFKRRTKGAESIAEEHNNLGTK
jgi:hypothetical protein